MYKPAKVFTMWIDVDTHQEYETLLICVKEAEKNSTDDGASVHLIDVWEDEGISVDVNDAGMRMLRSLCDELNKEERQ